MSEFAYLTFTLPEGGNLHDSTVGGRLLLALAAEASGLFIRPKYLPRTDPRAATINQPVANDAATLARFWADALADPWGGERTYFAMRFAGEPHFYVDFHVDVVVPRHLFLLVNRTFFKRADEAVERAARLRQVAGVVYRELRPRFGFGWVDLDDYPLGWRPDLTEPERQFDINLLGPALVERWGRANLLSTPARHIELYADGGMLIDLSGGPAVA